MSESLVGPARHWSLIHSGTRYALAWDDGERLLGVSSAVRTGSAVAQHFTFIPRGESLPEVTIFIDADHPFELLTELDAEESHWFG